MRIIYTKISDKSQSPWSCSGPVGTCTRYGCTMITDRDDCASTGIERKVPSGRRWCWASKPGSVQYPNRQRLAQRSSPRSASTADPVPSRASARIAPVGSHRRSSDPGSAPTTAAAPTPSRSGSRTRLLEDPCGPRRARICARMAFSRSLPRSAPTIPPIRAG